MRKKFHAGVYVRGEAGQPVQLAVPDIEPSPRHHHRIADLLHLAMEYARAEGHAIIGFWTRPHREHDPDCCP